MPFVFLISLSHWYDVVILVPFASGPLPYLLYPLPGLHLPPITPYLCYPMLCCALHLAFAHCCFMPMLPDVVPSTLARPPGIFRLASSPSSTLPLASALCPTHLLVSMHDIMPFASILPPLPCLHPLPTITSCLCYVPYASTMPPPPFALHLASSTFLHLISFPMVAF